MSWGWPAWMSWGWSACLYATPATTIPCIAPASLPCLWSLQGLSADCFLGLAESADGRQQGNASASPNLLPLLKEIWNR
jgi:hypothetical protein